MCAESGTGPATAVWMVRTDRLHNCPSGSRTLPRGLGRTRDRQERARSLLRIGGGLSPLSRAVPHAREQPGVQRFLAGGDPRSFGGCSAVSHSADPTLPRPLSTAKTINTVAGRLPPLAQRPAHPVVLIPRGPIARHLPRLPNGVRSSESAESAPLIGGLAKSGLGRSRNPGGLRRDGPDDRSWVWIGGRS